MANLRAGGDVLPTQAPEDFDTVPMTQLPGDFSSDDGVLYLSYSVTPGLASFELREGVEYLVGRLDDDADILLYDGTRSAEEQQIHRKHAVLQVGRDTTDELCLFVRSFDGVTPRHPLCRRFGGHARHARRALRRRHHLLRRSTLQALSV
mmetsp:Transcript_16556/g.53916  ORF Transcript_16556/g.53916 Transcript_16556/m.53916 type:complete len:150 (+) Transcript_16556:148-597(+)